MIFEEFLTRSADGGVDWTVAYEDANGPRRQHLQVWNQMIEAYFRAGAPEKAVGILEKMMQSPAPAAFGPRDVPRPASSTYTVTIAGFIQSGDIDTAFEWFQRLLQQKERPRQPYESSTQILRPDVVAWQQMLDGLAMAGRVDDVNRMFLVLKECAVQDGLRVRDTDRELVYLANIQRLPKATNAQLADMGPFLLNQVLVDKMDIPRMLRPLWEEYVARGMPQNAIDLVTAITADSSRHFHAEHPVSALITRVFKGQEVPLAHAVQLARLAQSSRVAMLPEYQVLMLQAYAADQRQTTSMDAQDWEFLLSAAVDQEIVPTFRPAGYTFGGLVSLLEDMAATGDASLQDITPKLVRRIVKCIFVKHGTDELRAIFTRLGPRFVSVLDDPERAVQALASAAESDTNASEWNGSEMSDVQLEFPTERLVIDKMLSRSIDEVLNRSNSFMVGMKPNSPSMSQAAAAAEAYNIFRNGLLQQHAPTAFVLGKLIQTLGRTFEMDKVRDVYTVAQVLLQSLEADKQAQSSAWFTIENSMIIALAHAGDLEAAHTHRTRILELGGAPTADAYGALILYVKDTTDDTSNAMALFQESQVHRVAPNQYLYNNIISKLAKARKADYALELFEQMKADGTARPSSITYGAVIGACARVGDVHSAENLFTEMMAAPNYRPRIPPFNTMMQLYTTTKPNRDRALFFYNQLRPAKIAPTAYTYKASSAS
jgi:pentatricopeptide repeat protein